MIFKKNIHFFILSLFLVFAILQLKILGESPRYVNQILPPGNYKRLIFAENSFSRWLQNLPLKEENLIYSYNGKLVAQDYYQIFAVLAVPMLFKSNLEQCADYCMRLWAEYHMQMDMLDNLYLFDYGGSKKYFKDSGRAYKSFLKHAFAYSNSYSLKRGCVPVDEDDVKPGDMLVQNDTGGIGHVSMILDACQSDGGETLFLIGFSFMPAQEFHIEMAREGYGQEGWFTLPGYIKYLKEFFDFGVPVIRRFLHP